MSEQAIVLNELTKHYGKHRGINNLSFSVNQGEFFGFIGPNGAGKSTTIRTLMGLIRPTGGSASIFDLDCHSKASVIARDVGYLPSENTYKAAVRAGTVFVLAAYVLAFTAEYTGNRFLDYLTPLRYYDVYEVALNGVYLSYIVLTVLIVGACVMVSTRRWKLREL